MVFYLKTQGLAWETSWKAPFHDISLSCCRITTNTVATRPYYLLELDFTVAELPPCALLKDGGKEVLQFELLNMCPHGIDVFCTVWSFS